MRLTMEEKKALVKATASRYRRSTKKAKKKILDEFVESTGYNRSYASLVLSRYHKGVWVGELRIVGDVTKVRRRRRERYYDDKVLAALRGIWAILDWICGKRLAALLGIDSDNGSEFINAYFLKFCRKQKITFTRSKPHRKNDNCFVSSSAIAAALPASVTSAPAQGAPAVPAQSAPSALPERSQSSSPPAAGDVDKPGETLFDHLSRSDAQRRWPRSALSKPSGVARYLPNADRHQ
jgi:hypothetical protein